MVERLEITCSCNVTLFATLLLIKVNHSKINIRDKFIYVLRITHLILLITPLFIPEIVNNYTNN